MLEKVREYFENEYREILQLVERIRANESEFFTVRDIPDYKHNSLQRMLGVAMFAQHKDFGLTFDEIDAIYTEYREKIEAI